MVLDEVWRGLDDVAALSGPHGGPLRRTVKLILDPLVIRPVQFPDCAGPVLNADGAVLLAARINAAADVLRATAAWFTLLKQVRRALRITEGNPQDLYFQRCFELATVRGAPNPLQDRTIAESILREIHEYAAGRTAQALKEYVSDGKRAHELIGLIEIAWRRRPGLPTADSDQTSTVAALLDACGTERRDLPATATLLDRLITGHAGTHLGIRLWHNRSAPHEAAHWLGLTVHRTPRRPELGTTASKADLGIAFDRTIYERVFTVLQASSERAELPPIPELVGTEIARSCAPWALLDESLRATATIGVALAIGLTPLGNAAQRKTAESATSTGNPAHQPDDQPTETAAHRVINSRWQREAYVLQARRLAVHVQTAPATSRPSVADTTTNRSAALSGRTDTASTIGTRPHPDEQGQTAGEQIKTGTPQSGTATVSGELARTSTDDAADTAAAIHSSTHTGAAEQTVRTRGSATRVDATATPLLGGASVRPASAPGTHVDATQETKPARPEMRPADTAAAPRLGNTSTGTATTPDAQGDATRTADPTRAEMRSVDTAAAPQLGRTSAGTATAPDAQVDVTRVTNPARAEMRSVDAATAPTTTTPPLGRDSVETTSAADARGDAMRVVDPARPEMRSVDAGEHLVNLATGIGETPACIIDLNGSPRTIAGTPASGPLAVIAAELRTPWRLYLRRLWVRLHGRDVREYPVTEPRELWDLLDGVARSVILDHRMRVKRALSVYATVPQPDSPESRAS